MGARAADVIALIFVVLIVYILVRPRSKAAEILEMFTNAILAVLRSATGLAREGV